MRHLSWIAFVFVGFLFGGCYCSHELPPADAGPAPRFHFCEPWAGGGPGVPEGFVEATGYRGCCVEGGEFRRSDAVEPGMFVKATDHTVFYIASDGRRYVFPSSHHLASWFVDASRPVRFGQDSAACEAVVQVADDVLAAVPLGGNAPARPGLITLGLYTRDRYATDHGNVLRVIDSSLLGDLDRLHLAEPWLDDSRHPLLQDSIFPSHHIGEPVTGSSGYDGERLYREATIEEEIRLMNSM